MTHAVVAVRPSPHRVQAADGTLETFRWGANIPDLVAVEAALRHASRVTVVGVGGSQAGSGLRTALQRGADRAVLVSYEPIERPISEKYTKAVATVTAREGADLLLFGAHSPLMGTETGGLAGGVLDWPVLTQVTGIGDDEVAESGSSEGTAVQRKRAAGKQEVVTVEYPAILVVDSNYANPRRAPLDDVVSARRTDIERLPLEDVLPGESRFSMSIGAVTVRDIVPNERWGSGNPPREQRLEARIARMLGRDQSADTGGSGEIVEDTPEAAADAVVDYLERNSLL